MSWKQFLTEKVLKGCWHDGTSILMAGYHCKKCDKIFSCNRTFDNRSDLMDLYEQIEKDGKLISFLNYLNSVCDWKDFDPIRDRALRYLFNWLFCLDGSSYEEKCKMVSEFYGWKEAVAIHS